MLHEFSKWYPEWKLYGVEPTKAFAELAQRLVKSQVGQHAMFLDITDGGIGRRLYQHGSREEEFMMLLAEEIEPSDLCLDLGANIGYTTLVMAERSSRVLAVEPDPHNLRILKKNIRLNGYDKKVSIVQAAISDRNDFIDFWIAARPNLNSVQKNKQSIKKIKVPAKTLGEFLSGKEVNFIKMDVEGHEVEILAGGMDYFRENSQNVKILLEVHPMYYSPARSFAAVLQQYFSMGFNVKYVVSTPIAIPKLFAEAGYLPDRVVNADGRVRGIYKDISEADAIRFSCFMQDMSISDHAKIVRSILIERHQS